MRQNFMQFVLGCSAFAVALASTAGVSVNTAGAQTSNRLASYDGRWWLRAGPEEREGFAAGFIDCYDFEVKGPLWFHAKSAIAYRDLVNSYLLKNVARQGAPVSDAFVHVADRAGEKAAPGGEVTPGPHGFYDGQYWVGMWSDGGKQQLGFVEGYLACNENLAHSRRGAFSKAPSTYQALISRYYKFDPETGDTDEKKAMEKIPDVLFRFRDSVKKH